MSTDLYWEPNREDAEYFGKQLKYVIAPLIWRHDGSLSGDAEFVEKDTTFWDEKRNTNVNLYDLLTELSYSKTKKGTEAKKMIDLIDKYDGIWVSLKG